MKFFIITLATVVLQLVYSAEYIPISNLILQNDRVGIQQYDIFSTSECYAMLRTFGISIKKQSAKIDQWADKLKVQADRIDIPSQGEYVSNILERCSLLLSPVKKVKGDLIILNNSNCLNNQLPLNLNGEEIEAIDFFTETGYRIKKFLLVVEKGLEKIEENPSYYSAQIAAYEIWTEYNVNIKKHLDGCIKILQEFIN